MSAVSSMGTLVLTQGYCPNAGENREENVLEVSPDDEEVMCDTEHTGADGPCAHSLNTGQVGVSQELCFSQVVSSGDAGDMAGDAAAAMIYSEMPGGHLLPPDFVQRMGRGQALAARGPAWAQAMALSPALHSGTGCGTVPCLPGHPPAQAEHTGQPQLPSKCSLSTK